MQQSGTSLENSNIINKFSYYTHKYGVLHAVFSYIGRYNISLWKAIGSSITRPNLQKYLATTEQRILNLGGGGNCLDGCLTGDIDPRADVYIDVTKKLPFDDNSIDAIFCEEIIEHIDLDLGRALLGECQRILKPQGILRIATPDLDWFASQVANSLQSCHDINSVFYNHDHRYLYTRKSLRHFCEEAGFVNICESIYQDPNSKLGYLDSHADRFNHPPEISQYLEMWKSNS
jgi:predicted SAM-dependent methyltransferase